MILIIKNHILAYNKDIWYNFQKQDVLSIKLIVLKGKQLLEVEYL